MSQNTSIAHVLCAAGLITLLLPSLSWAQSQKSPNTLKLDAEASSPPAQIDAVSWLSGYWRGEGLGADVEEIWSPPIGDRMIGVFSMSRDGNQVFSEAMALVEENDSLILKIKHFNPDFTGWEEKDDYVSFPLVRLGEKEIFFSGLTFRRQGDQLEAFVVVEQGGQSSELSFTFTRSPL